MRMRISVPGRSTNGKNDNVSLRRSELLKLPAQKWAREGASGFVRVLFLLSALTAVSYSQDIATLTERLHSGSKEDKRTALMQLRSLRSEEASRVAVSALKDKSPIVRATAASSVLFLPRAEAAAALLPLLDD